VAEFSLTSTAFADGGTIPRRYTCDGEDRPPPLSWSAPPAGIGSLALVLDDPDAPGGGSSTGWPGDPPGHNWACRGEVAPLEGRNDFGTVGYRGPCPPRGHGRHRYRFRLHAVAWDLRLAPGVGVQEFERAVTAKVSRLRSLSVPNQR
jgi:phosphatidylethanolamine-binding protein (PEBP) family uncharacterized protein